VIRVVLDANVLVSAALARDPAAPSLRAFDALLDERIEVVGCPALLGEVASVLGRERLRRYLSIDEARRFVADLAAVMRLIADSQPPYAAVCRDPDDDYVDWPTRPDLRERAPTPVLWRASSSDAMRRCRVKQHGDHRPRSNN